MKFLKWFGWGMLWVILLPFLFVGIALVAVFGIPVFFVELAVMIFHFFKGETCFPMYEEDKKAMEILQKALDAKRASEMGTPIQNPQPQNVYVQQNYFVQPPQQNQPQLPPQMSMQNQQFPPQNPYQPPYIPQNQQSIQQPVQQPIEIAPVEEEPPLVAPAAPKKPALMEFPSEKRKENER